MKIKYDKAIGHRIKKGSYKIQGRRKRMNVFNSLIVVGCEDNHWWSDKLNKWCSIEDISKYGGSNHNHNIKNLKQAIRHIKKHTELKKGTRLVLVSRFIGYNIEILV